MLHRFVLLIPIVFLVLDGTAGAATIIHAGRLIDGKSDQPRQQVTVVIEAGRITDVVEGYLPPTESDRLIRLTEHTVMPGLMDMHTHLMSQHSKDSYTERFFMDQAEYALRSDRKSTRLNSSH